MRPHSAPSVLAVTSEMPWPLDSGGHLRTFHLTRMLARRFHVRLVLPARGTDVSAGCTALRQAGVDVLPVAVPSRNRIRETMRAIAAAIGRDPYLMFGRHYLTAVRDMLREQIALHRPDVIYFDHLDSFAYADAAGTFPVVVDLHNVYSRLAARAAAEQVNPLARGYLSREARLIAGMEARAARSAHTVMAVSDDEAQYFSALGVERVALVPNGVDCTLYEGLPLAERTGPPTILYVGSFNWQPNVSAARFLVSHVLPVVERRLPDARVVLIGKDPGPDVMALAAGDRRVVVAGNVPDLSEYLREAHVLAVPLETGGGTRLKILEAFAAGLPVVSTPVGCEGIAGNNGEHLVIADRSEFGPAVTRLLSDPLRAHRLAARARRLASERYDWRIVGSVACEAVAGAARSGRDVAVAGRLATSGGMP